RTRHGSAIAAQSDGRRRGNGRAGSPREIPGDGGGPGETERAKPALSGADQNPKAPETETVNDAARVIATEHFFRPFLRPSRLLRGIRACAAKSLATLLLARVPARGGARSGPGAAVETGARCNPEILIVRRGGP